MTDEERAQLQREMGQAFYADVLKLEDENKRLREALEGSQALNGVDAARVAQMQRELELAKDELAALTVRFDETAKELADRREYSRLLRLRLGAHVEEARTLLEKLGAQRGVPTPADIAKFQAVSYRALTSEDADAYFRKEAYDLIEREWAELHVTQALRVPSAELAWYVNGFCAPDRTLFGAVETWRELQQQKGDKEP